MKKLSMLLTICAVPLVFASSAMAWTLVYANDAGGNATYGNIQTLIDSVRSGKQVRFVMEDADGLDAQLVQISNGMVFAQNTSLVGWAAGADGSVSFNAPGYYAFYAASSKGNVAISRWRVGEHVSEGDTQHRYSIKWFVQ